MEAKSLQEIREVIQSSHINFLLGAGVSRPFFPVLGNIENALNEASTPEERETQYKKYLSGVMLPNKAILEDDLSGDSNYQKTQTAYQEFFRSLTQLILKRKSSILSKQANLFTTNIDILMEKTLESLSIGYNDGFTGKFEPVFGLSNFKKSTFQRSLHFDHTSEIPVVNIIKIHGSLTWKHNSLRDKILFSGDLSHIHQNIEELEGEDFETEYRKILVVNPEEAKHLESVLNLYYSELLRLYSSELEKENATLFVLGFSMADKHIREITLRAAKSNPTLRVFVCCSNKSKESMEHTLETERHPNIQIITPQDPDEYFTLTYFTNSILDAINNPATDSIEVEDES